MNTSDFLANDILTGKYVTAAAHLEMSSTRIDKNGTGGTFPTTVSRTEIPETVSANNVQNATEIDFVNNDDDYFNLLESLLAIKSGRHYYNPHLTL